MNAESRVTLTFLTDDSTNNLRGALTAQIGPRHTDVLLFNLHSEKAVSDPNFNESSHLFRKLRSILGVKRDI